MLQGVDQTQSQIDAAAFDDGFGPTGIDAGSTDFCSVHSGFTQVEFGSVKTPSIIDGGHHVFDGVMRFEKKALVALYGIRGRVPFGKGVTRKTFDLSPNVLNQIQRLAISGAVVKKLIFDLEKLGFRAVLARHAAAQHVGLSQVKPAKIVGHFNDVFLIDHNPVSLWHDVF